MTSRQSSRAAERRRYRALSVAPFDSAEACYAGIEAEAAERAARGVTPGVPDALMRRIRRFYEKTAVPVREIARLAGVTERTLYKYAKTEGWKPRYKWKTASVYLRGRGWEAVKRFAPVRGAGGRLIRRGDQLKPVARGLKATDSEGRRRALGALNLANRRARLAAAEAAFNEACAAADSCGRHAEQIHKELLMHRAARCKALAGRPAPEPDMEEEWIAERLSVVMKAWHFAYLGLGTANREFLAASKANAPSS